MRPTNLTLEERERWAYANGDVERAKLLAEALEMHDERLAETSDVAYDQGYQEGFDDGMAHARDCDAF